MMEAGRLSSPIYAPIDSISFDFILSPNEDTESFAYLQSFCPSKNIVVSDEVYLDLKKHIARVFSDYLCPVRDSLIALLNKAYSEGKEYSATISMLEKQLGDVWTDRKIEFGEAITEETYNQVRDQLNEELSSLRQQLKDLSVGTLNLLPMTGPLEHSQQIKQLRKLLSADLPTEVADKIRSLMAGLNFVSNIKGSDALYDSLNKVEEMIDQFWHDRIFSLYQQVREYVSKEATELLSKMSDVFAKYSKLLAFYEIVSSIWGELKSLRHKSEALWNHFFMRLCASLKQQFSATLNFKNSLVVSDNNSELDLPAVLRIEGFSEQYRNVHAVVLTDDKKICLKLVIPNFVNTPRVFDVTKVSKMLTNKGETQLIYTDYSLYVLIGDTSCSSIGSSSRKDLMEKKELKTLSGYRQTAVLWLNREDNLPLRKALSSLFIGDYYCYIIECALESLPDDEKLLFEILLLTFKEVQECGAISQIKADLSSITSDDLVRLYEKSKSLIDNLVNGLSDCSSSVLEIGSVWRQFEELLYSNKELYENPYGQDFINALKGGYIFKFVRDNKDKLLELISQYGSKSIYLPDVSVSPAVFSVLEALYALWYNGSLVETLREQIISLEESKDDSVIEVVKVLRTILEKIMSVSSGALSEADFESLLTQSIFPYMRGLPNDVLYDIGVILRSAVKEKSPLSKDLSIVYNIAKYLKCPGLRLISTFMPPKVLAYIDTSCGKLKSLSLSSSQRDVLSVIDKEVRPQLFEKLLRIFSNSGLSGLFSIASELPDDLLDYFDLILSAAGIESSGVGDYTRLSLDARKLSNTIEILNGLLSTNARASLSAALVKDQLEIEESLRKYERCLFVIAFYIWIFGRRRSRASEASFLREPDIVKDVRNIYSKIDGKSLLNVRFIFGKEYKFFNGTSTERIPQDAIIVLSDTSKPTLASVINSLNAEVIYLTDAGALQDAVQALQQQCPYFDINSRNPLLDFHKFKEYYLLVEKFKSIVYTIIGFLWDVRGSFTVELDEQSLEKLIEKKLESYKEESDLLTLDNKLSALNLDAVRERLKQQVNQEIKKLMQNKNTQGIVYVGSVSIPWDSLLSDAPIVADIMREIISNIVIGAEQVIRSMGVSIFR